MKCRLLGVVLNAVDSSAPDYYYAYRYYQLFYDTGAVWDRPQERSQKQSVGAGFKKEAFQLAVAFPVGIGWR